MICVIDYGMGNLRSVSKALEKLGGEVVVSASPADLEKSEKIVLPGVGAFGDGSHELQKRGLFEPLKKALLCKKKFLGICLGMQLLFEESEESPGAKGLGIFQGKVQRFRNPSVKIPHMGWNEMKMNRPEARIFKGLQGDSYFYFVHSYYPVPKDTQLVLGMCEYGGETFAAFIGGDPIYGSQFHPEKSQEAGLQILHNFVVL